MKEREELKHFLQRAGDLDVGLVSFTVQLHNIGLPVGEVLSL